MKCQSRFPLLIGLVDPVQALSEAAAEQCQQGLVVVREWPFRARSIQTARGAAGCMQCNTCRTGDGRIGGQQPPLLPSAVICPDRVGQAAQLFSAVPGSSEGVPPLVDIAGQHRASRATARAARAAQLVDCAAERLHNAILPVPAAVPGRPGQLALPAVVLGGESADVPTTCCGRSRGPGVGDVRGDPHPVAVAMVHGHGVAALALLDAGRRRRSAGEPPVGSRSGHHGCSGAYGRSSGPKPRISVNALLISMTAPTFIADEERLLQGLDQCGAPPGVMGAQPGQLHVGPDPCQQVGRGERLDQVVVGAGPQALDGCLLPGPGRQQQHRHGGGARRRRAGRPPAPGRPGGASSRR